jgi:hypothetical protein
VNEDAMGARSGASRQWCGRRRAKGSAAGWFQALGFLLEIIGMAPKQFLVFDERQG